MGQPGDGFESNPIKEIFDAIVRGNSKRKPPDKPIFKQCIGGRMNNRSITLIPFLGLVLALVAVLAAGGRAGLLYAAGRDGLEETFFGQPVPGAEPVLFAPDILLGCHGRLAFSPDGREIFWSGSEKIYYATFDGEKLTSAKAAPFVDFFRHDGPVYSPDGRTLYFVSNRGLPIEKEKYNGRIWMVERSATGWGQPVLLSEKIDRVGTQISVTDNGRLYFIRVVDREWTYHSLRLSDGRPSDVEPVRFTGSQGIQVNDIFVDPQERFLLASIARSNSESFRMADLVISFKQDDGAWGEFRLLNDKVNTDRYERFPGLSPDGRFLFFVRSAEAGSFRGPRYYWIASETLGIPGFPPSPHR
jgi:hypothetical protein